MALGLTGALLDLPVDRLVFEEFADVVKEGAGDEVVGVELLFPGAGGGPDELGDAPGVVDKAAGVGKNEGEGDVVEAGPFALVFGGGPDLLDFLAQSFVVDEVESGNMVSRFSWGVMFLFASFRVTGWG